MIDHCQGKFHAPSWEIQLINHPQWRTTNRWLVVCHHYPDLPSSNEQCVDSKFACQNLYQHSVVLRPVYQTGNLPAESDSHNLSARWKINNEALGQKLEFPKMMGFQSIAGSFGGCSVSFSGFYQP